MKISFDIALITGSSRGLGRAIAVKLAQEGVQKIAVHYLRRRSEAEKTLVLVRGAGAEGVLVQVTHQVHNAHGKLSTKRPGTSAAVPFLFRVWFLNWKRFTNIR
jgi:NAD(P)-dependent dehydrogenase (short-subunit alcohol dehydrogenase family)